MKKLALLTALASIAMMDTSGTKMRRKKVNEVEPETEQEKKERIRKFNALKGLKEFIYSGQSVWATNKKNADKKAKKLNLV